MLGLGIDSKLGIRVNVAPLSQQNKSRQCGSKCNLLWFWFAFCNFRSTFDEKISKNYKFMFCVFFFYFISNQSIKYAFRLPNKIIYYNILFMNTHIVYMYIYASIMACALFNMCARMHSNHTSKSLTSIVSFFYTFHKIFYYYYYIIIIWWWFVLKSFYFNLIVWVNKKSNVFIIIIVMMNKCYWRVRRSFVAFFKRN